VALENDAGINLLGNRVLAHDDRLRPHHWAEGDGVLDPCRLEACQCGDPFLEGTWGNRRVACGWADGWLPFKKCLQNRYRGWQLRHPYSCLCPCQGSGGPILPRSFMVAYFTVPCFFTLNFPFCTFGSFCIAFTPSWSSCLAIGYRSCLLFSIAFTN